MGEPDWDTLAIDYPDVATACAYTRRVAERVVRNSVSGPWPFPQLFRYLARRSLAVPWSQVTEVNRPRIDISARRDQLRPARR